MKILFSQNFSYFRCVYRRESIRIELKTVEIMAMTLA